MNTIEIKKNFHILIDRIENEMLLLNFYDLLKKKSTVKDGELWERLSEKEKEELLLAVEESKNSQNLISHENMKKKHEKWL